MVADDADRLGDLRKLEQLRRVKGTTGITVEMRLQDAGRGHLPISRPDPVPIPSQSSPFSSLISLCVVVHHRPRSPLPFSSPDLLVSSVLWFGLVPSPQSLFLQIVGSVAGVKSVKEVFPMVGHGARLNVNIHHGALTEGVLTFMTVMVSLGLKKKDPKSFFMKTWISSIAKLTLHILGSELTGGIMNPASAFGWAYARGDHITLEHLFVYWFAPIQATILALWSFRLFWQLKERKQNYIEQQKAKAE